MLELNVTINSSIVFQTYNQSNVEQLCRCSIRTRSNDKCVKGRFFVVSGDGPALLEMPDIDLLGIMTIMHETIGNKQTTESLMCKLGMQQTAKMQFKQGPTDKAGCT